MNMFLKAIALSAISLITVHCKSTSSESALQSRKQDKDNWYGISTNGVKYDGRTGKIVFSVKKYACQRGYKPEYKIEVGACAESFPADCSVSLQYDLDRNPDGPGHGNCYLEDSDVSFVFANTKLNSQYYSGATLTARDRRDAHSPDSFTSLPSNLPLGKSTSKQGSVTSQPKKATCLTQPERRELSMNNTRELLGENLTPNEKKRSDELQYRLDKYGECKK